jgi:hypothetical protein
MSHCISNFLLVNCSTANSVLPAWQTCRKILVLTSDARGAYSRGFMYNLVTSDADNLQQLCSQAFTLISSPLRIAIAMVLLYSQLGCAAFAAFVLLVLVIPLQASCLLFMLLLYCFVANHGHATSLQWSFSHASWCPDFGFFQSQRLGNNCLETLHTCSQIHQGFMLGLCVRK